jgi:CHAT domain-containing protein
MACHGACDTRRDGQVQLIIGDEPGSKATLDMNDVLELPISADVVYLGCCLAGQTVENLDGEPTGFVSGFFLRGTQVLIGSVVLVDDAWGALLGLLFEHHYRQVKSAHRALALAKADIASGDWDPTGFGEDVCRHVESLRNPRQRSASRSPIPPQPILGDLLYGMRIFGE